MTGESGLRIGPAAPESAATPAATLLQAVAAADFSVAALVTAAEALTGTRALPQKHALYNAWLAHHPDDALRHAALFNFALVLSEVGEVERAVSALAEAIARAPTFLPAYVNLGIALERLGRGAEAARYWFAVIEQVQPPNGDDVLHAITSLKHLSRVLKLAGDVQGAEEALRRCLSFEPRQRDVIQHWVALRQMQCKWPAVDAVARLTRRQVMQAMSPLSLAIHCDDPLLHLASARRQAECDAELGASAVAVIGRWTPPRDACASRRLRIGYVSPDLREHAVGYLTVELFELHDRAAVEVFAYYSGRLGGDPMQNRIRGVVDHWRDIGGCDARRAASMVLDDGIDILVDLGGYTCDAPTALFALRPAPIIVNWLGYPGSMATPHHQYIIADAAIIPPHLEKFYSERVVRLPCYQPTDRKRLIGTPPSRQSEGLREDAVVFCCFNGTQKITPGMFQLWLTILANVPNSQLWLLSCEAATDMRLRATASARGIAPDRLVFAPRRLNADHLARYQLADLFLDTFPYGAHTTASDALWMGVPVLTLRGLGFAARVCASLVGAAGLQEMICDRPEDYVRRAVELGRDPEQLRALRERLHAERDGCVLFDMPALARQLETLYRRMWGDFLRGEVPEPDLSNLSIYFEIGTELEETAPVWLDPAQYQERYRSALTYRDAVSSIPPDPRLWPPPADRPVVRGAAVT